MTTPHDRFSAVDESRRWRDVDPYPDIPPALLNAKDIQDYVAATGMIDPFHPEKDQDKLKAASYEVDLLGTCVYWDATGGMRKERIEKGQPFVLEANSIAFVTLEPDFRLPTYIALRFNLRITHVYRGLLLGTGPLIDPGWSGKLSIPLHNLTTNPYRLIGGEGLIWVEFTKVSGEARTSLPPHPDAPARTATAYENEGIKDKSGKDVEYFLRRAEPHRPIQSGIPAATSQAAEAAREALATTRVFRTVASVAVVGLVIGLASLFWSVYGLIHAMTQRVDDVRGTVAEVDFLKDRVAQLERAATPAPSPAPAPPPAGASGARPTPSPPP